MTTQAIRAEHPTHPRRGTGFCAGALAVFFLALACIAPGVASAQTGIHRVALVVGANDGGGERVTLRYAEDDARRFVSVMQELGGLTPIDTVLLTDPTQAELDAAFAELGEVLAMSDGTATRTEVIFYYSGHSDESGLLLHGDRISYKALRGAIDELPADVRVIVLDSCAAGALTRTKGGQKVAPFLVDESSDVSGHAFLTSSSADEVAQESDRLGGSFFTHYLVSGLRGAADISGDEKVTLNEAYQFAFSETLATTESTRFGPQHAVYEIQLTGTGDLVLTDLRETDATLELSPAMQGRVSIRDAEDRLVAELGKTADRPVSLHVAAGTYSVRIDDGAGDVRATEVTVASGGNARIGTDDVVAVLLEDTTARGPRLVDDGSGEVPSELPEPAPGDAIVYYEEATVHADLVPGLGLNELIETELPIRNKFAAHLTIGGVDAIDGAQLGAIASWTRGEMRGAQLSGVYGGASVVHGAQLSGVAAVATEVHGTQIAGVAAIADVVDGAQVALVNVGGAVDGAQIGLINVGGSVAGTQVGLVNVADEVDAPIGLLNYVGDGIFALEAWVSETAPANVGLRMGGQNVYTQLSFGAQFFENETDQTAAWAGEAGFAIGGRIYLPGEAMYFDLDLQHTQFFDSDGFSLMPMVERVRGAFGYRFTEWFALYGGLSANVWVNATGLGSTPIALDRGPFEPRIVREVDTDNSVEISLTPGFFAGIELF